MLLGRAVDDPRGAAALVLLIAGLVNGAFLVIVGGDVALTVLARWRQRRDG